MTKAERQLANLRARIRDIADQIAEHPTNHGWTLAQPRRGPVRRGWRHHSGRRRDGVSDLEAAARRLRREGPSVHHILCDLRRPPVGTPKCTCHVSDVAAKTADLLESMARTGHGHRQHESGRIAFALASAILNDQHEGGTAT